MTGTIVYAEDTAAEPRSEKLAGLARTQDVISGVCAVVAGLALVAMTVITTIEVATRNLANHPLGWNVDFVEQYLLMSMAFFGIVTAYHTGAHIAVYTLVEKLPERVQTVFAVFARLLVLVGFCFLFWAGLESTQFAFAMSERPVPGSAELPLPTWIWKAIMPLGALLGAVLVLIDLIREFAGAGVRPTDVPEAETLTSEENPA